MSFFVTTARSTRVLISFYSNDYCECATLTASIVPPMEENLRVSVYLRAIRMTQRLSFIAKLNFACKKMP